MVYHWRRPWTLPTLRPGILSVTQEVAERQAGGLKYDNTDSDVDGSQQRGSDGEGGARIDASNYEEHGLADGRRGNHNSPPSAKYEANQQERRDHTSSVLRGSSGTRQDGGGAALRAETARCTFPAHAVVMRTTRKAFRREAAQDRMGGNTD
jgi:hypothetical protein